MLMSCMRRQELFDKLSYKTIQNSQAKKQRELTRAEIIIAWSEVHIIQK